MNKAFPKKGTWLLGIALLLSMGSCKDHMAEYYARPDWIKGNCYEVLQADGNYSIFLKGIDKAGFRDMVDGKTILTVMAPDDNAFRKYFQENGIDGLDALDSVSLDKLIGFHLMYYAYSADKLNNFRPEEGDDVTDEEKKVNAGLYYKHRTKSKDANTVEHDYTRGMDVTIYHQERFLPVFSQNYFNTKRIEAERNYHYFFPDVEWNATGIGYNVANAGVTEGNQITSNGYVHKVDHVLRPAETIYSVLKNDSNFSQFLTLYKAYEYFNYNPELTQEYGKGTRLYEHLFVDPMANIASEWPNTDYSRMTENSSMGFTIFAPTNEALTTFFNNYWAKGGYKTLSSVSRASLQKLLFNCVYKGKSDGKSYDGDLAFPEQIERGDIINSYGAVIDVNLDAVPQKYRILCENGLMYGCSELAVPAMFAAVTGPAYQYKDLSYYLLMLTSIGDVQNTLWSNETRLLALMPSNAQVSAMGITYDDRNGYLVRNGKALDNNFKTSSTYAHLVDLASCTGFDTELDSVSSGQQVFRTFSPDYIFYWYVQDGKITNSFRFNERIYPQLRSDEEVFCPFHALKSYKGTNEWSNGFAYSYDSKGMFVGMPSETTYKSFQQMAQNNKIDTLLPYYAFTNLLITAGMYTGAKYNFYQEGDIQMMLIPSNQAVYAGIKGGKISGLTFDAEGYAGGKDIFDCCSFANDSLKTLAQTYLKQYFIPFETAGVTNYPYIGWDEDTSKGMPTLNTVEIIDPATSKVSYKSVKAVITDKGDRLTCRLLGSSSEIDFCGDWHYLPFVFDDGCIQFVNGMF